MHTYTMPDEDEDIDLFGDFILDENEQDTSPHSNDFGCELDPEEIRKSVEEFHKIFTQQDGELSIASGAMLMYQHLQAAGYLTDISIEDHKAIVSASSEQENLKSALIDRVEDLLDEMVFVEHNWRTDKFNVHSIATQTVENAMSVTIEFNTI